MMSRYNSVVLFDAGMFIGALLRDDPRHAEARPLVEAARRGDLAACTTTSILSEVYAALTWIKAQPSHTPIEAAAAVRALVEPPSAIEVLSDGLEASLKMLELSGKYGLTARRIHDARHAATSITNGITQVYTYDVDEWLVFKPDGIVIVGPGSSLLRIPQKA
jgi:predicted nucleic acid-binding protein